MQHKGAHNHTSAVSIMSVRLTTIVKPPSTMRVELMKRRGIMPTWPMATLPCKASCRGS
jgi:hypothetical protein